MYGLRKHEVERIIKQQLDKNPDLKYYINNDYFDELVSLLIDGISTAIEENNKKFVNDFNRALRK